MIKIKQQNIVSIIVSIVLFAAVPVVFAWDAPKSTPPSGNAPAPITVSDKDQIKDGGLGLKSLAVFGQAAINDVKGVSYDMSIGNRKNLALGVNGRIGADEICDKDGNYCIKISSLGGGNTTINNSTTQSGNYVFINPSNYTGGPLACTPGINYQISNLRVTAKKIATYTDVNLVELQPGTWTVEGRIAYGRFINSEYNHGFRLRSDIDSVKKTIASQNSTVLPDSSKGSGAASFSKKIVDAPVGKTTKIELGVFNAVATGPITLWCK